MTATMLEIALDYGAGGAAVLPLHTPIARAGCSCMTRGCAHPGKHPRVRGGKDAATTDPEIIERWWRMWPAANIGIRPAPGLVVLDVDPRHGGDVQLAAMQRRLGALPETRTARTGSGGEHRWFRHSGDVVGQIAPGIDVKAHTGYLVVPPDACTDRWVNTGPVTAAPGYLRALLARPAPPAIPAVTGKVTPAVVAGLIRYVADAPEGRLNISLYWSCARAHEKGIDVGPIIDAAVEKGHPRRAAERTAASAAKAPPRRGGAR